MSLKELWHKVTFLGLEEHEEHTHKEVLLLNKMVLAGTIIFLPIIPIDYFINGWKVVKIELLMFFTAILTFIFIYKRWFTFAKIYFFILIIGFVWFLGIAIGKGTGNYIVMYAVLIAPAMLFKDLKVIILLSGLALSAIVGLPYAQEAIDPIIHVDQKVKEQFALMFKIIIAFIIFFQVYYFKNINLNFQEMLSNKNDLIAEKNKEIVDSINYAKHIQSSYLPPTSVLSFFFEKSFLLFEPKDIVSGDFYWFYNEKIGEGYSDDKFIVAADCTGHGVPGAIMSVICANALNDVIVTRKERETGKILDEVRNNVVNILKGKEEKEDRKDGMDVAMVRINKSTGECQFSGAHNPLWILRKDADEFEIIKADKQPVGAFENPKPFTTNSFQLNKGDRVYLFSDGFQDQFGGEKGKKYKAANMKKLFVSLKNESFENQKEKVQKAFADWKGDLEQVDDVVLIALEF